MFINADFLVNSLFNTERYQFTPANYIGFFFMLSCNGPTLSEWESTPHVANIPLWCFVAVTENTPLHDCMVFFRSIFETQRSWNNRSCLSNQLYCMTSSEMISRILQSSLSEFVFVVSVFCTWADQQAKAKRADYFRMFFPSLAHHPSAHKKPQGENVFVIRARKNRAKQLLVLLRFSFYSALLFC